MGVAARIRTFRVRAGKSAAEVVKHLGLNEAWYDDLEHSDDEFASTLTLFQAVELAALLGVRLRDLVSEETSAGASASLIDLPSLIEAHMARAGISLEQFEEQVGWELKDFMKSPVALTAESPMAFLQAIAQPLGIDWISLLPDEHAV